MENNNKSVFGGIFGKSSDPDLNIPVTGGTGGLINPYLNLDPRLLQQDQDQYILPEGAEHQRGRFEMAFAQIGGSILTGGALGGMNGGYRAVIDTNELTGKARRTQMLNIISRHGASSAQAFGVIALWYSLFGVITSKARGVDDSFNTLLAGTGTGIMYSISEHYEIDNMIGLGALFDWIGADCLENIVEKEDIARSGRMKMLRGGGIGLGLAAVYCLFTNPELRHFMDRRN